MPRSDQFDHGYVVGILVTSRIDGPDPDRTPDAVGATSVRPEFKRKRGQYKLPLRAPEAGAHGMLVSTETLRCAVLPSGHITADVDSTGQPLPDAQPGVWLPVGVYDVTVGAHHPGVIEIEVTTDHTVENPCDIYQFASVTPSPATPTTVLPVPADPAPGEVLAWGDGGLVWLASGTVDPAVVATAVSDYLTANPPAEVDLSGYVRTDDPRLTDARDPLEHDHPGYLTADDLPAPAVIGGRIFIQQAPPADPQPGDVHLW